MSCPECRGRLRHTATRGLRGDQLREILAGTVTEEDGPVSEESTMPREIVDGRPGQRHGAYGGTSQDLRCGGLDCTGGRNVQRDGDGCADGCCSDYRCQVCGERFRVEWPA